jgi:hypothetical protein
VDVDQAEVAFAALDGADIRAVEVAAPRQRFLRKPFGLRSFRARADSVK